MKLTSTEFENNGFIPGKYTCEGEGINPPLDIEGIPRQAVSLVLVVEDPDAPGGTWVHWLVYDIPVIGHIASNAFLGKQGINDSGRTDYIGPCPPSGTHRYFFRLYALDKRLDLKEGLRKKELEKAMKSHVLDKAELVGLYKSMRVPA